MADHITITLPDDSTRELPTGATAADLAARFGIDLAEPTFWTRSLDVLRTRIDEYERLALSAS